MNRTQGISIGKNQNSSIPDLNQTKEQHLAALGSTLLSTAAERDQANLDKLQKIKENIEYQA